MIFIITRSSVRLLKWLIPIVKHPPSWLLSGFLFDYLIKYLFCNPLVCYWMIVKCSTMAKLTLKSEEPENMSEPHAFCHLLFRNLTDYCILIQISMLLSVVEFILWLFADCIIVWSYIVFIIWSDYFSKPFLLVSMK